MSFVLKSPAGLQKSILILSLFVSFQEFEMSRRRVVLSAPLWPLYSPAGAPIYPLCVFEGFSLGIVQPFG